MKFSILIPAYKSKYLREAIDSCLSQTFIDFELIIVNDNSPEDIDSLISKYDDVKIKYYKNSVNFGAVDVVDNWNKCLEYSLGDYVICMGDDDKLLPTCLEEYDKLINKYPNLDVYHTRVQIINEASEIINLQQSRPEWESVYSLIWHRNHGRIQYIGDFLFRKDALKGNGGFYKNQMALSSDDITVVIAAEKNGIANTQSFGFQYRESQLTITNSGNIDQTAEGVFNAKNWYKKFLEKPAISSEDELMRIFTIKDIENYYHSMFRYLMIKDMIANPNTSLEKWLRFADKYGLSKIEIKNENKILKKNRYIIKLKSFYNRIFNRIYN